MNFSRIYSLFFVLISMGLFAHAKPIDTGLSVRQGSGSGCCDNLINILVDLKVKVLAQVDLLKGPGSDPSGPLDAIVVDVKAATEAIANVKFDSPCGGGQIKTIVDLIVEIIVAIVENLGRWPIGSLVSLCVNLNVALGALLKVIVNLSASIGGGLLVNLVLQANVGLLGLLGLVNVVVSIGL